VELGEAGACLARAERFLSDSWVLSGVQMPMLQGPAKRRKACRTRSLKSPPWRRAPDGHGQSSAGTVRVRTIIIQMGRI